MNKKDMEVLALTECLLLWDRLAETGEDDKQDVIEDLYEEGLLSRYWYSFECPFCEYLRDDWEEVECNDCLWPGTGDQRCTCYGSPYAEWADEHGSDEMRKKRAKKVLKLLLKLTEE